MCIAASVCVHISPAGADFVSSDDVDADCILWIVYTRYLMGFCL